MDIGSVIEEALSMLPKDSKVYSMPIEKSPEEIIDKLKAENARLEREADWLARKHWPNCPEHAMKIECTDGIPAEDCRQCWREAARKATESE